MCASIVTYTMTTSKMLKMHMILGGTSVGCVCVCLCVRVCMCVCVHTHPHECQKSILMLFLGSHLPWFGLVLLSEIGSLSRTWGCPEEAGPLANKLQESHASVSLGLHSQTRATTTAAFLELGIQ